MLPCAAHLVPHFSRRLTLSGTRIWRAIARPIGQLRARLRSPAVRRRRCIVWLLAASAITTLGSSSSAREQSEEFMRALRDRGLEELALDYLKRMETSRLAGDEFRRRIPFHRGTVLLALSRRAADPALRTARLGEARAQVEQFAVANPESAEAAEAQIQLGGVLVELARQSTGMAAGLPQTTAYDAQREKLRSDARGQLDDAGKLFQRVAGVYAARLELAAPPADADEEAKQTGGRRELRARVAQAQYLAANAKYETAQTHAANSAMFRQLHEAAAKELAALADQYASTQIWGYYARLDEGRCYQALGQYPLALGCYREVQSRSSVLPVFRTLISRAYAYQAECLSAQGKFDDAIEGCRNWLSNAEGAEEKQSEWIAVRFQLAEALRRKGESLPADSADRRRLLAEAQDEYRPVSITAGVHQPAARTAVAMLRRGGDGQRLAPKVFTEAYEQGKEALSSLNAAKQALPTAERNNPDAVAELKTQIDEGMEDARRLLNTAMMLVDSDTDISKLNEVRYFVSWLYWEEGDYYRAAVLGDFLARRYPDHAAAASAARIAIASYERLGQQAAAAGENRSQSDFAARRAANMAEFVTRRWPGTRDAEAAVGVLVNYAIRNDRVEEAERLLAGIPADDRARLELQLGIAMWSRYLELAPRDGAVSTDEASREKLKSAAIGYLRNGIDAARATKQVNESSAAAVVYLAQALVSSGDYSGAVAQLEDPVTGPLTLLSRNHPSVSRTEFAVQTHETALRAYVSANPPQSDKVMASIESLEKAVQAAGSQSAEQLTRVYLGLGVQLQRQIDALQKDNREEDAERLSAAFAQLLDRIAERSGNASWSTRQWVAQSYYNLGATDDSNATPSPKTGSTKRSYLTEARDIYQSLLSSVAQADPRPTETALLAARFQLGECYRGLGEFQQALDIYSEVLKEKESSLAVQRAAALAYQKRGQAQDAQWLERAIHGGYQLRSTGENRIWGWLKLAQVADKAARSDPKYRDTFFEARFNMARCRYLIAMQQSEGSRKQDLAQAKQSIQSVARLYPEMGGPRWRGEFDALMKQIQTAAGEQVVGLREFAVK